MKRKRSWAAPGEPLQTVGKPGLHPKKAMLCIWWNCKGPIFYEHLVMNETERYCKQLDNLKASIQEIRSSIINEYLFKKVYLHFLFNNRTNFPVDLIYNVCFIIIVFPCHYQ